MANICNTQLIVYKTTKKLNTEKMKEWLEENYAYDGSLSLNWSDEEMVDFNCDTKWNVIPDELAKFCKEFGVKVRAIGQEDGNMFIQVACIDENGKVVQDDAIAYKY
jgi:hypothetical protein